MLVTRQPRISWPSLLLAQLPFGLWMIYLQMGQAAGSYTVKRFTDDPVYVTTLLMLLRVPDMIVGPIVSYWSDSIWTRWGRRTPFITFAALVGAVAVVTVPFMGGVYSVIAMLLVLQTMIAVGQTYQALSQELVPLSQRGRASGVRSLMFQVALMIFFSVVIGRFDDVYRHGFIASHLPFNGEIMTYFFGAACMALPAILMGVGVIELRSQKEAEQHAATAALPKDGSSGGRALQAISGFFKGLCAKELVASYLTILVFSCNIEMMSFNYLLYTEQWGYSKQDMGGNIALGILIMIGFTFLAGILLDKVNAAKALFWTMGAVALANLSYILFVNVYMGGQRPTLFQILCFGELTSISKWVSTTICWTLMFQFVPKNRMGAATAGVNIFVAICVIASSGLMGNWINWYSKQFAPPAGTEVRVTLASPKTDTQLRELMGAGYYFKGIDTGKRGSEASTHWAIREANRRVGELLAEKKSIENAVSERKADAEFTARSALRIREIESELEVAAKDWEARAGAKLATALAPAASDGQPVIVSKARPIDYNYFSGYFLVMAGGAMGMALAWVIVVLERRGFFQQQKDRVEALS